MRVLDALTVLGRASTLSAVAQQSGMPASQAHRYLVSLIAVGVAKQDDATGLYDLGPAALRLGLATLARADAFQIADKVIAAFTERTGLTVQLAALGPHGPTIIRWMMGRPAIMTSFTVGSVLPLLHSATGQVFLAFSPPSYTAHLLERELADSTIDQTEADALCLRVKSAGRAHVEGAMISGLRATAFPILDLQGRAILTATALTRSDIRPERVQKPLQELEQLCRGVSAQLGWAPAFDHIGT